jgi:menaquinone-dependent protoporphyrinogen oxidase
MKVLVTVATRHGATAEVAAIIARVLRLRGMEATELPPADVVDIEEYDAVVLGSAVYAGRWLAPATSLVERLQPQLAARPVWLFSSGPIGDPPNPLKPVDVSRVVASTGAIEHRLFAGKLDKSQLGLLERAIVRVAHASDGDFRDWREVSHWAAEIADTLAAAPQLG